MPLFHEFHLESTASEKQFMLSLLMNLFAEPSVMFAAYCSLSIVFSGCNNAWKSKAENFSILTFLYCSIPV